MSRPRSLPQAKETELREKFTGANYSQLASEFGVSSSTVRRIVKPEPFAVKPSFTEFGESGLKRFGGNIQEDYLREWSTLDRLVPTVKKMLDHPTVAAVMFAVEMTMRGATWTVEPPSADDPDEDMDEPKEDGDEPKPDSDKPVPGEIPEEDPEELLAEKATKFLEGCMDDMSHTWDDFIAQAVTMVAYGFAPFEIVYKRRLGLDKEPSSNFDDGLIGWRKFGYRAPDTLAVGDEWIFDPSGGIQGLNQATLPTWQKIPIPIEKLILFRTTAAKNNPQGRSMLRGAYTSWYGAKTMAELEGIAAERMGAGIPIMYLGKGTSLVGANSDYEKAKDLVRNVRIDEQFGIVVPRQKMGPDGEGMLFELLSPPSRGIVDFNQVVERYKQEVAQTLLAQFLFFGLSERGTQALAVRSTDFFTQAVEGWLEMMAQTINMHAVKRLFRMNPAFASLRAFPRLEPSPVGQVDVGLLMTAISQAAAAGVLTKGPDIERAVREALNLPEPPAELDDVWAKKEEARMKLLENPIVPPAVNPGAPAPFAPKDVETASVITESLKVMREAIMRMGAEGKPAGDMAKELADVAREVRMGRAQANTIFVDRLSKIEKAAAEQTDQASITMGEIARAMIEAIAIVRDDSASARRERESEAKSLAGVIAKMGETLSKVASREPTIHVAAPNVTVKQDTTEVIDVQRDNRGLIDRIIKRRGG